MKHRLEIHVRGRLRVFKECGTEVILRGAKDKALLVLLAYSPKNERTRNWIVDKLWSDRFTEQARTSLRQVLKNLRKSLGENHAKYVSTTRNSIQLVSPVTFLDPRDARRGAELFEDLDVRDPEFEDWVRELRARDQHDAGPYSNFSERGKFQSSQQQRVQIGLILEAHNVSREERLIAQTLLDTIAVKLESTGTIQTHLSLDGSALPDTRDLAGFVELQCLSQDCDWYALARVTPRNRQHFAWSGRLTLPMKFSAIWGSADLAAFANRVQQGVVKALTQTVPKSSYLMLNRATQLLFSGNAGLIKSADQILEDVVRETGSAAALAWRAYARLTQALEFRDINPGAQEEADLMVREALKLEPNSALVCGLASTVQTKLIGDFEYGHHLALEAITKDDRNAQALDALSQALIFRGEHERAHHISDWARESARHSPNAFNWDMSSALSALSLGRLSEARQLAYASHVKAPHYRPALRYLYALNLLEKDMTAAARFENLLRQQEPGFQPQDILQQDYPVETLRWLGLQEDLLLS